MTARGSARRGPAGTLSKRRAGTAELPACRAHQLFEGDNSTSVYDRPRRGSRRLSSLPSPFLLPDDDDIAVGLACPARDGEAVRRLRNGRLPQPFLSHERTASPRIFAASSSVRLWASLMTIFAAFSRSAAIRIKIGNDLIERLKRSSTARIEGSACRSAFASMAMQSLQDRGGFADVAIVTVVGFTARAFYDVAFAGEDHVAVALSGSLSLPRRPTIAD